jgi:hypothetical protein
MIARARLLPTKSTKDQLSVCIEEIVKQIIVEDSRK